MFQPGLETTTIGNAKSSTEVSETWRIVFLILVSDDMELLHSPQPAFSLRSRAVRIYSHHGSFAKPPLQT